MKVLLPVPLNFLITSSTKAAKRMALVPRNKNRYYLHEVSLSSNGTSDEEDSHSSDDQGYDIDSGSISV
jgi:hypothetical protein